MPAPITQELNLQPTGQPYKLTFYYEKEKQPIQQTTENGNHDSGHHGNYDGLVVQSYDNSAVTSKNIRYVTIYSHKLFLININRQVNFSFLHFILKLKVYFI